MSILLEALSGRDTHLVNDEPTPAIDGRSESLNESRGVECRGLSNNENSEEPRSSC